MSEVLAVAAYDGSLKKLWFQFDDRLVADSSFFTLSKYKFSVERNSDRNFWGILNISICMLFVLFRVSNSLQPLPLTVRLSSSGEL